MPIPEKAELQKTIAELMQATQKGEFQWSTVNPSTYVWEKRAAEPTGVGARITLQRIEQTVVKRNAAGIPGMVKNISYILQVHETTGFVMGPPALKLSVSGADDADINADLNSLYTLISTGISADGIGFLKSLLKQH